MRRDLTWNGIRRVVSDSTKIRRSVPMQQVSLHEAETQLSRLIEQASQDEIQ